MRHRVLLPLLIASICRAGDVDPHPLHAPPGGATTPVSLSLAEGKRLIAHWHGSLYETVWNDPALSSVRAEVDGACQDMVTSAGIDPRDLLAAMGDLHLAMLSVTKDADGRPQPQLLASVALGDFAAKVMKLVAKQAISTTVAGADEALTSGAATKGQSGFLVRYGPQLVATLNMPPPKPTPLVAPEADLQMQVDAKALIDLVVPLIPQDKAALFTSALKNNPQYQGVFEYRATLVHEGILERLTNNQTYPGGMAVDRKLMSQLPATTMIALGIGVDGKASWKANRPIWMAQAAAQMSQSRGTPVTAEEAEDELNHMMSGFGVQGTLQDLVEGFTGTMLIAVGQGVPFPTATIAIPRSPMLDGMVELALKQVQAEAPAEGASTMLPIPGLPVAVNIIRDAKHWVLSSDAAVTSNWTAGEPGGWATSPAGALALAKAPDGALCIGSSDTPTVIRTLSGYLTMLSGMQPGKDAKERQMALMVLSKLGAAASTGYLFFAVQDGKTVLESRGLTGIIGIPTAAVIAGAIGKHQEMTAIASGEGVAIDTLRKVILPGEAQFQAGAFLDQDGNGIGEFGLLSELGGVRSVAGAAAPLSLIPKELASGTSGGWRYQIFLPDGKGGAIEEPQDPAAPRTKNAAAARSQEKHWVAYAWPDEGNLCKHMFCMLPDGVLREAPYDGDAPDWSDVFGGGTSWDGKPTWDVHHP